MNTRNTAGMVRAAAVLWVIREEKYLDKVDNPIPERAPRMLRIVISSCMARSSWAEKTSSFRVSRRNAY